MSSIQIPSYKTLVPNNTWSRDQKLECRPELITQLVQLTRYTNPQKEAVIDLIRNCADDYDPYFVLNDDEQELPLSQFMNIFPSSLIEKISMADEDITRHLMRHIPIGPDEIGRTYLKFASAMIPNDLLDSVRDVKEEQRSNAYSNLIHNGLSNRLYVIIRLDGTEDLSVN